MWHLWLYLVQLSQRGWYKCLSTWITSHFIGFPSVFGDEKLLHVMTGRTNISMINWANRGRDRDRRGLRLLWYRFKAYWERITSVNYPIMSTIILFFKLVPPQWMNVLHNSSHDNFWEHSLKCSPASCTLSCLALRVINHSMGGPSSSVRHHAHLRPALIIHWSPQAAAGQCLWARHHSFINWPMNIHTLTWEEGCYAVS